MSEDTVTASTLRIADTERSDKDEVVVREFPLTIIFNDQELVTMLCSPSKLKYLALGFLTSEGLIRDKSEVKKVSLNEKRGVVRVDTDGTAITDGEMVFKRFITSGCGKGATFRSVADAVTQTKVDSQTTVSASQVFAMMKEFQHISMVFKETGGVHSASLSDGESLLIFTEDIGRHNAIDKIFGECLWEGVPTEGRIILTSGRVSSEVLSKVAKRGIPIIASRSAPTDLAIRTALELGITLLGFVRGTRMNVYANDWRISV
ncbi:MAG: formate dehydrogenase accessory sulfurtransferase FdhD [Chloroflexota bacterium]|nr:formate dehydrogenase accessory sulfurtransferase FdhD [Chloroflexota bacterium]